MKTKRVVLGVGELGIADSCGETKAGWTIPTAFGLTKKNAYSEWKKLKGVRIAGKRVRLVAEILPRLPGKGKGGKK